MKNLNTLQEWKKQYQHSQTQTNKQMEWSYKGQNQTLTTFLPQLKTTSNSVDQTNAVCVNFQGFLVKKHI